MPRNAPHRYPRTARVNEVLIEIVAEELERLSDPRLEMVTRHRRRGVDRPRVRDALLLRARRRRRRRRAKQQAKATSAALHKATPHLRRVLGRQVRWRNTPFLTFKLDPSVAAGQRIEELLREIHARDEQTTMSTHDRRRPISKRAAAAIDGARPRRARVPREPRR